MVSEYREHPFYTTEKMVGSGEPLTTTLCALAEAVRERTRGHLLLVLDEEYNPLVEKNLPFVIPFHSKNEKKEFLKTQELQGEKAATFLAEIGVSDGSNLHLVVDPLISGGMTFGLFCLYRETPFSREEVADFCLFSAQAANALLVSVLLAKEKELERCRLLESDVALLLLDEKGNVLQANKEAAALLGYSPDDMRGMPSERLLPPEKTGHRGLLQKGSFEGELLRSDGGRVSVNVTVERRGASIPVLCTVTPAERELLLRDYYETTMGTTEDMIFIMDLGGRFIYVNRKAKEVMGEDVIGRHFEEVITPEYRERARQMFEMRKQGVASPVYTLQATDKKGVRIWLAVSGTPLLHQGKVVGTCGSARDITDTMRLEEQREHLTVIANNILQRKNLDEILDTLANAIRDHCAFRRVVISLLDEHWEATHLAFTGLTEEEEDNALKSHLSPEQRRDILREEFRVGRSYYIPHDKNPWGLMGVKSKLKSEELKDWHPDDFLFIPLYGEQNKVIGLISVDDPVDGRAPTAESLRPVELFATQAAIAIENARLYRELSHYAELMESKVREKTHKREALLETTYRLREVTSWEKGMQIILDGITKGLGIENSELFLINETRQALENIAVVGGEKKEDIPLSAGEYVAAQCVSQKKPINIQKASTDPRVGKQIEPSLESFAWVPIMTKDTVLGAIAVGNRTSGRAISDDEVDDLMLFASLAANFVESTRFFITPAVEDTLSSRMRYRLEPGESYLFEGKQPSEAFEVFIDAVTHGIQGFSICRTHPQKVRHKYGLEKTPIMWLSTIGTEGSLDPKDLAKINHFLNDFLRRAGNSIILLEGIEYLIIQNSFERVIKSLHPLHDYITLSNSRLLIPVNPMTLSEKELSILRREFRVFK